MNQFAYFLYFLKASLFSSGGLANLPSLHQDLIDNGLAQEADFGHAVTIGQLSPGPNGLWVISLGYLTNGFLGAILTLLAIMIPPALVLVVSAVYNRIESKAWAQGLMRGIQLASVGLVLTVSWSIVISLGFDIRSFIVGGAAFLLAFSNRVPVIVILVLAAGGGFLLYSF
ncbi:MAG: chromate transporter [Chloroflexi bacterium]|uniref:Chromate transporter n=1 Tax=Candidatus Chlorohelix allophototropha TaxID=3003348 RepID=A0A8T7M7E6_9CHLR|nr:chromate transporter [Chloroflexota bacterium]WJW68006.1 chromate transporter [Chloroflexota bacterium L227-S17]